MNKQTFATILQCALLHFEGTSENTMILELGLETKLVKTGIKLCDYLKSK